MSELIESNLSKELLASVQEKKLTKEGWSKAACKACQDGKVVWNGRTLPCPSCNGTGWKWRPGSIVKASR